MKNITNGKTGITIDEKGAIARIMDVASGQVYFDACETDRRLFHFVVPSPVWKSRPVTAHESGNPTVTENEAGIILSYNNLEMHGQQTGLSAEVSFKRPPGTDEIQLLLKISNHGSETVTAVIFPWLNGWKSPGNPSQDSIMPGPNARITPDAFPHWAPAWGNGSLAQEQSFNYPDCVQVPWIDFSGEKGGVSCINYQREHRMCFAGVKNMAGHDPGRRLGIFWGFYAYIPPGGGWESPLVGISVHDGDWHRTADRYREWTKTWLVPASSKREFRESIGSEHVFFSYFDGTPYRPYGRLPEIAAAAREYGVRELCVWDRLSLGTYGTYAPDEDLLAYNTEDRQSLSRAIHKAVAGGTDVSALVNFRLMNPSLSVFRKDSLEDELQLALDGTTRMETYSIALIPGRFSAYHLGPYCYPFSPFSEKYLRRVLKKIQDYLDLGYTSLFYDQPFDFHPDYSRKEKGGTPEMIYAATLALIRDVREKLRARNPDAVIMGEQSDIFGSEIIDQWMCWGWSNVSIAAAVRVHYAMPHTVINCVLDREPGLASHAFAAGLHMFLMTKGGAGTLSDAPEFAEHIKKLARLRKRCADRTVHARFNDTQWFSLEAPEGIVAYSYESPAGPAIILAAPGDGGTAAITVDRPAFMHPGDKEHGVIYFLNGNSKPVSGDKIKIDLNKHEAAVWLL